MKFRENQCVRYPMQRDDQSSEWVATNKHLSETVTAPGPKAQENINWEISGDKIFCGKKWGNVTWKKMR